MILEFHSHDLIQTSQQPCKAVMQTESWAPGLTREIVAKHPPQLLPLSHPQPREVAFTSMHLRSAGWSHGLRFSFHRAVVKIVVLQAPAAIPAYKAFSSMSRELGRLVGRIVCLYSQSSLASWFCVLSGSLGFIVCYGHIAWRDCNNSWCRKAQA